MRTFITLIGLLWINQAMALALEVGMLTQVAGTVEVVSAGGGKQNAIPFLKVAVGDRLTLGQNAQVHLVFFDSSHQEVWKGSGVVEIGADAGHSKTLQAVTKKLPPLVARQLIKTPASGQQGATGMVTVRSLSSDTIESLQKQYQEVKAETSPKDTTPEVFLMTGLLEMKEYEYAATMLNNFRGDLKNRPELNEVIQHFSPLIEKGLSEN